jgi:DNA processing protein
VIEVIRPFGSIARVASPVIPFELAATDAGNYERARIEELLGPSAVPIDEIVRLSGMPSGTVQLVLLELDLAGRLDRHAGGKVSLTA